MPVKSNAIKSVQLTVQGCVQGVGFRPFVFRLAQSLALRGSIRNTDKNVIIDLFGNPSDLNLFEQRLYTDLPSAARIESIQSNEIEKREIPTEFRILASSDCTFSNEAPEISPDLATCSSCVKELFTPANRRFLHPFITCTQCGPRYSIISDLPYDRNNTSMNKFDMCPECEQEFQSPSDVRFHSQTNACHQCGPTLSLFDRQGNRIKADSNKTHIDICAEEIRKGHIIAMKSLGGFHLICDADNPNSLRRLRQLKARPDKPFALMALNPASLEDIVKLSPVATGQLKSASAPIVLLPKKTKTDNLIAPGLNDLGCILAYHALHYLLFHSLLGKPEGADWLNQKNDLRLIVTSANLPGEAILFENEACLELLPNLADFVLLHDRDIVAPSDDSVIQSGMPSTMVRRARGFVPQSIHLPHTTHNIVAYGAHLKNTFCLTYRNKAYLSPYIGELDSTSRLDRFKSTIAHYQRLFSEKSDLYCSDLHPDYASTYLAEQQSTKNKIPLIKIQHHHAHLASVITEQSPEQNGPCLGLILDGNGLGDNNRAWGGELFFSQNAEIKRIGHLEEISIPGGDIAAREIWRIGAALLAKQSSQQALECYTSELESELTQRFIFEGKHPLTSSAGRWFDAIASLIRLRQTCTYEGQAAAELEAISTLEAAQSLLKIDSENRLLFSPLLPKLLNSHTQREAASLFHTELVDGLVRWLETSAQSYQVTTVYCSGGCFQNRLLRESMNEGLISRGLKVHFNKKVPANDGGLSLGQAYLAKATYKDSNSSCV